MDDPRPDDLLDEAGRVASRLGLRLAWTDGTEGAAAKACTRTGPAGWKQPQRLSSDEDAGAGFFRTRARKRNPAVPAAANGLVLVEIDLEAPGDAALSKGDVYRRVGLLRKRLELPSFPATTMVQSRRGLHIYTRPPERFDPAKVQISEDGAVVWSSDGYVVGAAALHPSGAVYQYAVIDGIAVMPLALYERLAVLADATRADDHRRFADGEEIHEGRRRETIFSVALGMIRVGHPRDAVVAEALRINETQCRPPLDAAQVRAQVDGAAKHARRHPTETEQARARAQAILDGERPVGEPARSARERQARKREGMRALAFSDVKLSGPLAWVWRGKVPVGAVTLIAGRPKLGKSLLTIWLASQLSHGLLPGAYEGTPARTLIIAAEDPPDPIIKGRLISAAADESLVSTLVQGRKAAQDRTGGEPLRPCGLEGLDGLGSLARRIVIPDEYGDLEQVVVHGGIVLVVLDPLNSFISAKVDAHRDVEIRRVLDPLGHIAARRGFAAVCVVHLNRRNDRDILSRITGSGGYGGSARSILTFGRHPEDESQRVVAAEGNWQREADSELFQFQEVVVWPDADEQDRTQPHLVHVGSAPITSGDLVDEGEDDRSVLAEAKEFLMGELAFAPQPVSDLRRAAEANGIGWRTVETAKRLLGVEARRISIVGSGRGSGKWEWYLDLNTEAGQEHDKQKKEEERP